MQKLLAPAFGMRRAAPAKQWYDHVVVGAGTAGSVLASRLARSGARVLLLEGSSATALESATSWCASAFEGRLFQREATSRTPVWARGHASDYDAWACATDDLGWRHENVEAHLKRGEQRLPMAPAADTAIPHATSFLRACTEVTHAEDVGWEVGARAVGVGFFHAVRSSRAQRWARAAYLSPTMLASGADGQQLEVRAGTPVCRVRLEGGRATGVEWEGGCANAGEVILCAGTLGSPQLLVASGLGPRQEVQAAGVSLVRDLPGVGSNYHDHVVFTWPSEREVQEPSMRRRFGGVVGRLLPQAGGFKCSDDGCDVRVGGYVKSEESLPRPDLQVSLLAPGLTPRLALCLVASHARGRVQFAAAGSGARPAELELLGDERDRRALIFAVQRAQEILDSMEGRAPGTTLHDEAAIMDFLRRNCTLAGHAVGTCAMGSGERAVVDGQLRVRGVSGLRVADASVMPSIVAADPHGSVVAIAEAAAKMLAGNMAAYHRSQYGFYPMGSASDVVLST